MNKTKMPTSTILLCILLGCFVLLCGCATGGISLPSDISGNETFFAKITADIGLVDIELTKLASETTSTPFPTPSINSQNWPDHFLQDPTCQIPCWENIMPGQTNIITSKRIVAGISGVRVIYLEPNGIGWYFNDQSDRGGDIFANENGIVTKIDLSLGDDETLALSNVIESFGKPHAVLEGYDCSFTISYRYQGMLLLTPGSPHCSRKPVDIAPTTQINRIILFSLNNKESGFDGFTFTNEILWDGYKTYDFTKK